MVYIYVPLWLNGATSWSWSSDEAVVRAAKTWLLRLVVTLGIAVAWHWFTKQPPAAFPSKKSSSTTATEATTAASSTASSAKQRMLDKLDPVPNELELKEDEADDVRAADVKEIKELERIERETTPATPSRAEPPPTKPLIAKEAVDANATKKKSLVKKKPKRVLPPSPAARQPPPPFAATNDEHPGLQAFWNWCNVENSLFRIYTVGRTDGTLVVPPYNPSSRRGQVPVALQVTNDTNISIDVYWVDYKGHEVHKGKIHPGNVWTQTTWMEHPWVFRANATNAVLLYYIPYSILPTLDDSPTVDPNDSSTGLHRFTIRSPSSSDQTTGEAVTIDDPILPFPAEQVLKTPTACISWTLGHCRRMGVDDSCYVTLIKYLTKIVQFPQEIKYRQVRIANPAFYSLWQSPVRGLLLAVGFVEHGAYAELGCAGASSLGRSRIQDVALLLFQVEQCQRRAATNDDGDTGSATTQPLGADGFGRAGWGRAGGMNVSPD